MARVTVEDCNRKVPDRFELAALAAQAAKDINAKTETVISGKNGRKKMDKPSVDALRRIAAGIIPVPHLRRELLNRLRNRPGIEPLSTDDLESAAENFDYIPGGTDMYVGEDYSDLDNQIFDNDSED